jgi:putative transposase
MADTAMAMPEHVQVAMAEIAGGVKEGLLALAVGAGMRGMAAIMEESVTSLCGPRGKSRPRPQGGAARHRGQVGRARRP